MTIVSIYVVGFILTLVAISLDMFYRKDFEGVVAWILSLVWPLLILSVIFMCVFNFMSVMVLQQKIQDWYTTRNIGMNNFKRRKDDWEG